MSFSTFFIQLILRFIEEATEETSWCWSF